MKLWEDGVGGRAENESRERSPTRSVDVPDSRRIVEDGRSSWATDVTPDAPASMEKLDASSWVNWQSGLCLLALGVVCVLLAPITSLWWLVLLCVVAVLVALTIVPFVLGRSSRNSKGLDKKDKERQLLKALAERSELTPTAAAIRTSLTVEEASKMLDVLARKGHLKLRAEDGVTAYALGSGTGSCHPTSSPPLPGWDWRASRLPNGSTIL